jgi:hypothetical protein
VSTSQVPEKKLTSRWVREFEEGGEKEVRGKAEVGFFFALHDPSKIPLDDPLDNPPMTVPCSPLLKKLKPVWEREAGSGSPKIKL